jgi:maintenance of mitochondrial morphology protein 1
MASNYIFTLSPTFTQGLILGQLSILVLLVLVLKYLFLDTEPGRQNPTFHPTLANEKRDEAGHVVPPDGIVEATKDEQNDSLDEDEPCDRESATWFNLLLRTVRLSRI